MNPARSSTVRSVRHAALYCGLLPICLLSSGRTLAQTPQLLKDVNTSLMPNLSSESESFVQLGAKTVFVATRSDVGRELWISDGSSKGTTVLKDIMPGRLSSSPAHLLLNGSIVFFTAHDHSTGRELWKTDGTPQGTVLVRDLSPGPGSMAISQLINLGSNVIILVNGNMARQPVLWKSDGTSQGTVKISSAQLPSVTRVGMVAAGSNVYFCAGGTLWRTDGTQKGTMPIQGGVGYCSLMPLGNLMLFTMSTAIPNSLWRTDGTVAGTWVLRSLPSGFVFSVNHAVTKRFVFFTIHSGSQTELWRSDGGWLGALRLQVFSGNFYVFNAVTAGNKLFISLGKEAWISNGFSAGTQRLAVFTDEADDWTPAGNGVFFTASGPKNGKELWHSDGTVKGTREVLDINAGPLGSSPSELSYHGGKLYFSAEIGFSGREPWRSDGTAAGTTLLRDIRTGRSGSEPKAFIAAGSKVLFTADDGKIAREPWISDGTPNGTSLLSDVNPRPGTKASDPIVLGRLNGSLIFAADDGIRGKELWTSDGTGGRTTLLADIWPGQTGSAPTAVAALDNILFFAADDGVHGRELWKTDGSVRGTRLVRDIFPGGRSSLPLLGMRHQDEVFFTISYSADNRRNALWKSDGTTARTVQLVAGNVEFWRDGPSLLTSVGNKLFFAFDGGFYVSDGTNKGTRLLVVTSIVSPKIPQAMAVLNGEVYFGAITALWKSDGSKKGTVILHSIANASLDNVVTVGKSVFFRATAAPSPSLLYRTDGSRNGLVLVTAQVHPDNNVLVSRGKLLFFATDMKAKMGLWTSDGTAAGTKLLAPLSPDEDRPMLARSSGRKTYFYAKGPQPFSALWVTDGSASGTRLIKPEASSSSNPVLVNGRIFFTADDARFGNEAWVLDPGATAQALGLGCTSRGIAPTLQGSDPVLGGNMGLVGSNVASSAGILLLSTRALPSIALPANCRIYLAPQNLLVLAGFQVTNGQWSLPLFIPNQKSLLGLRVAAQSIHSNASSALGFDLSNGLLLSLGN